MRSLAPYLVTFPLLLAPLGEVGLKPALAQAVSAEQALELLARAVAADAKCGHLGAAEHQELADYLAKGEIAQAGRSSPAETQSIIATGRAQGRESLCGADSRAEVGATLAAARDAVGGGDRREVAQSNPEPAPPIEKPKQAVREAPRPVVAQKGDLARYGEEAMAYHVERRCGHLSNAEAREFWNAVVARHEAVLKTNRRRQVAAVLASAEARAARQACGRRSAALVAAVYDGMGGH
jgi:hypothetical protein